MGESDSSFMFRKSIRFKRMDFIFFYISTMKYAFTSKIELLEKLKLRHITVSKEILEKFWTEDDNGSLYNQRFIITLNDTIQWQAGSVSLGNNTAYITVSTERMKQLQVDLLDTVNVELERDFSEYGFDVPIEFEEVLNQDSDGKKRFDSLTLGKRRATIYLVIQVKSSDKRIEKSIAILENLKRAPQGKETMRHILGKDLF